MLCCCNSSRAGRKVKATLHPAPAVRKIGKDRQESLIDPLFSYSESMNSEYFIQFYIFNLYQFILRIQNSGVCSAFCPSARALL